MSDYTPIQINKQNKVSVIVTVGAVISAVVCGSLYYKEKAQPPVEKIVYKEQVKEKVDIDKMPTFKTDVDINKPIPQINVDNNYISPLDKQLHNQEVQKIQKELASKNKNETESNLNNDPYLSAEETFGDEFSSLPGLAKHTPKVKKPTIDYNKVQGAIYDPANALRKSMSKAEVKYENTGLEVQHTITALFSEGDNTPPQKIRLNVPVLYESRQLALTDEELVLAKEILIEMREYQRIIQENNKKGIDIINKWNAVVKKGSPTSILYPDSPSLIENQGGQEILKNLDPSFGINTKIEESN